MTATLSIDNSTASKAIQILLTYLNISSDQINITKSGNNVQNPPFGLSPMLKTGDKTLTGASAIALWLVNPASKFTSQVEDMAGTPGIESCKVYQWINLGPFIEALTDANIKHAEFKFINNNLLQRTFLLDGTKPTLADIFLYVYLHSSLRDFDQQNSLKYPALCRWFDNMQHLAEFNSAKSEGTFPLETISFDVSIPFSFEPFPEPKSKSKKDKKKEENKGEQKQEQKGDSKEGKNQGKKKDKKQDKKQEKKQKQQPKSTVDISLLDIRVGKIVEVKHHPDADALYVEQIDIGEEESRTVVSGLVKHVPLEKMQGAKVAVAANLKPAKMRGIESKGMVLCASSADHSSVVLLDVPEDAKVGEKVTFPGFDGEPGSKVNKKKLDKILPDLVTTSDGTCMYKDAPFTTSAGVIKATITNGTVG